MPRMTKYNNLTSPELLSQVNPDNMRLKNDFLEYLKSVQRSPQTCKGYSNDLDIFFVYVLENLNNKRFAQISKRDIVGFQGWLINENGNSPARVRRIKAAISSLSNYVESVLDDEEEFKGFRSIVRKIESPVNQPVREKTVLSEEEVDELLAKLTELGEYKKACLVALAFYSGRRKAELVRFRVRDFDESNLVCDGALYKTEEKIKTKGAGGGKYIYCYTLAKKFRPYLERWLQQMRELGIESEWLFPDASNPAEQMRHDTLNSWARSIERILGKPFYFHCARHAFTSYLVRAGLPDGVIQEIVGWSSGDMVKTYTDIEADEQIGMWFKDGEICAPDAGFKGI